MQHEKYMKRCIELAKMGKKHVAPNPMVGSVLVYRDQIIGEGYHRAYGSAHAEVACIQSVAEEHKHFISESVLYVNLEPCFHYGNTPPCVELVLAQQIKHVVIGTKDPNPKVAGKSVSKLQKAGIHVETDICKEACIKLNRRFFVYFQKKRPYIILKWAQTKNGYIGTNNNRPFWITNNYSKMLVHQWRSEEMAILVGDRTVHIDNPSLTTRLVSGQSPTRIIINKDIPIHKEAHVLNDQQNTILFTEKKYVGKEHVEEIIIDFSDNVLQQVLDHLYQKKITSLIVEGGRETLLSFINEDMWDEARIFTGNKTLEEGIPAPTIRGNMSNIQQVHDDELLTIYHPKALDSLL